MRNYELRFMSDNECLPAWYRDEHYEYCDSMYSDTYEAVRVSLFQKIIKYIL